MQTGGQSSRSDGRGLDLARLATFPEENPNLVIEMELDGSVTYLNPEARARFPDLAALGAEHPLLAPIPGLVEDLTRSEAFNLSNEVHVGDTIFEQKICYTPLDVGAFLRIYAHDITALREAEQALHRLAHQIVTAQEDERARVSRELHDEAGQALTALKISLDLIRQDVGAETDAVASALGDAISLVDETRERIRRMARGLRPPALDVGGVTVALDELGREFARRTRIEVDCSALKTVNPGEAASICLYRVMQEALTNVAAHADASRVTVSLESSDGWYVLRVADDGVGIQDPAAGGIGLHGMRERVEMLGGILTVTEDGGTHVVAALPSAEIS